MNQSFFAVTNELKSISVFVHVVKPLNKFVTTFHHNVVSKDFGITILLSPYDVVYEFVWIVEYVATDWELRGTFCFVNSRFQIVGEYETGTYSRNRDEFCYTIFEINLAGRQLHYLIVKPNDPQKKEERE